MSLPLGAVESADEVSRHTASEQMSVREKLALLVLALATAVAAVRAAGPVRDPDTWWHLRLGEEFRQGWSLADPGQLTPFATRPWFATQWTLELLVSYLEEHVGLVGVAWLTGVGVILLAVVTYRTCRLRASVLPAVVASVAALLGSSLSHSPRPQLASFILVSVVMGAWLRTGQDWKPRWWLIPLTWAWACTHGMWFIGIAIGFVAVLGMALDRRIGTKQLLTLLVVPVGSIAAAAATPVGPKLLIAGYATSQMAPFVSEWDPPDFSELVPALAAAMVGAVVVTWARSDRQRWADILLLGLAAIWILAYYRTIAIGVLIAAPFLAIAFERWIGHIDYGTSRPKKERGWVWSGVASVLMLLTVLAPLAARDVSPRNVSRALEALPAGSVVFNSYGLGGWLEWRHRNVSPVIDGMADAYYVEYFKAYDDASRLRPGWYRFVMGTGADYALLDSRSSLAQGLLEKQWRPIAKDDDLVLLSMR